MALTALLCAGTGPGSSSDPRRACGPHRRLNGAVVCAGCLRCDIGGITRVPDAPNATLGALRGFRGADAPNATRALRGIPRVVQRHRRFMGIPRGSGSTLVVSDASNATFGASSVVVSPTPATSLWGHCGGSADAPNSTFGASSPASAGAPPRTPLRGHIQGFRACPESRAGGRRMHPMPLWGHSRGFGGELPQRCFRASEVGWDSNRLRPA